MNSRVKIVKRYDLVDEIIEGVLGFGLLCGVIGLVLLMFLV